MRWGKLPILLILRSVAHRRVSKDAVLALPRIAAMVRDAQAERPALLTMRVKGVGAVGAWLYILRCADGSYYTGTTRSDLEIRISQHETGHFDGYTATRRPVTLVFSDYFDQIVDAIAAERQIKGWSRAKKEALIAGRFDLLPGLSRRRS